MVESITNSSVQHFVENNSGQLGTNSGQTQDRMLETESASAIGVQPTVEQTQDTQDSFFTSAALSPAPVVTGNEIKSTDLNFGVLSCPEFENEAQNQETVGISEDLKTQDSCQKNVLSCPEFKESVLSCPEIDGSREARADATVTPTAASDVFKVSDLIVLQGLPGKIIQIDLNWQKPYQVETEEFVRWVAACDLQKPRTPKVGDRISHGEFTGTLAGKAQSGWHVSWNLCPSLLKRFPAPPAVVKDGEFKML
jgi:hypothetical protein